MTQWTGFEPGLSQGKSSDLPIDLEKLLMFGCVIFKLIMVQILYLFKKQMSFE